VGSGERDLELPHLLRREAENDQQGGSASHADRSGHGNVPAPPGFEPGNDGLAISGHRGLSLLGVLLGG
jgi:hypothetical protein